MRRRVPQRTDSLAEPALHRFERQVVFVADGDRPAPHSTRFVQSARFAGFQVPDLTIPALGARKRDGDRFLPVARDCRRMSSEERPIVERQTALQPRTGHTRRWSGGLSVWKRIGVYVGDERPSSW